VSLVNDMLRDLNKRTPVSNQAARVHGAIQSSIESKRPRIKVGLIAAGCVLAGLGAGYFYFETLGVQVVQVPLAATPQPQTLQPAVQNAVPAAPVAGTPESTQIAAVADPAADVPALENVAEIRELAMQPNGFTFIVETSEELSFEVRDRSAFGLTLHLDGVDRYDRAGATAPGMSLLMVTDGLDIGIELEEAADFLVREDSETPGFDILITASYRPSDVTAADVTAPQPQIEVITQDEPPAPSAPVDIPAPSTGIVASLEERSAPVRVNRELSLEDRDRNNSQNALIMATGGQMTEAYRQLLVFLEENPGANQSRETLAKLLFAQQEYVQATVVIDQGLAQTPNNAAFKKIKARLLLQANDSAQALALLRNVPPAVAADTEYSELLAQLYQQQNYHKEAVAVYQDLLRIDRQQGRWWTGLGISLEAQDMDADALTSFQAALQTGNLDRDLRQYVQSRVNNLSNQQ
jgi:tetratricopeptide (TPR) repeat protein